MDLKSKLDKIKKKLANNLLKSSQNALHSKLQENANLNIEKEVNEKVKIFFASGLEDDFRKRILKEIESEFIDKSEKIIQNFLDEELEKSIIHRLDIELPKKIKHFLLSFFPFGILWDRDEDMLFHSIIEGLTNEFVKMEKYRKQFKKEIVPKTSWFLLPEWEELLRITNYDDMTIEERQNIADIEYHMKGSLSCTFFDNLAKRLGYDVVISSFPATTVENFKLGEKVYTEYWSNLTKVQILKSPFGEKDLINSLLIRLFKEKKPFSADLLFTDKDDNIICLG